MRRVIGKRGAKRFYAEVLGSLSFASLTLESLTDLAVNRITRAKHEELEFHGPIFF